MSFISFRQEGKDIILNTNRIISVSYNPENKKIVITCTDNITIQLDDTEEEIRRKLGVRRGERPIGFGQGRM